LAELGEPVSLVNESQRQKSDVTNFCTTRHYFQGGQEWIGQPHINGVRTEDHVPHLDARWWEDIAKAEIIDAQKVGEFMKQNQQKAHDLLR
jgi:hypothetical protein